ncbi:MAG TPA: hypothetical protein VFG76_06675, partial [Candidatus Polarisedimenticolia bacterium]|nr:hypothetical protein [Candidatus Polarisedimenticolia bacterium]
MEPRRAREGSTDAVLLLMLYGLEAALLLMAIGVHGHGGAARLWALSSRGSRLFAGASVAAAIMAGALIWRARRSTAVDARTLSLTIAMNLFTVALGSASAEILLRATAKHSPQGTFVAGRLLLPRSWGEVAARNLEAEGERIAD